MNLAILGERYGILPHQLLARYDPDDGDKFGWEAYGFDIAITNSAQAEEKATDGLKKTHTGRYVKSLQRDARKKYANKRARSRPKAAGDSWDPLVR